MFIAAAVLSLLSFSGVPIPLGDPRAADSVELRNGSKLAGRVVYEDESRIVLREGSREREIERREIKSVVSRAANAREALGRWLELKPTDPHALLDIVRFCERMDLADDARAFARVALVANADDVDAHETLGHQRRSNGWAERVGSRWVACEELPAVRASWKTAWELSSTHYNLRSNLDIATAVGALLDLELFYRSFFDRFGKALALHEVIEPMDAQVHATRDSYPVALVGRVAYFDASLATVMVDASNGLERGMLIHEATHQLLRFTGDRSLGISADFPAWLDEGLAEYMRACMSGPPGRIHFDEKLLLDAHFKEQATAKEPYDLARLLTFDTGEFHTASKSDLRYAEAYTLVQFCLHGEGGKYRERFFEFVRGAYKSKGSPTHFKAAMQIDDAAFENAWTSYVRAKAR